MKNFAPLVFAVVALIAAGLFRAQPGHCESSYARIDSWPVTQPVAVAVGPDETVYAVSAGTGRLSRFAADGTPIGGMVGLGRPTCIAVDHDSGNILVGRSDNGVVEVFDATLAPLFMLGQGEGEFQRPTGIAVGPDGRIYVADGPANQVKSFNSDGTFLDIIASDASGTSLFDFPTAVSVDRGNDTLVVADLAVSDLPPWPGQAGTVPSHGARVQLFTLDGGLLGAFGKFGLGDGAMVRPSGLAAGPGGAIYVSDSGLNLVQIYDHDGFWHGSVYDPDHLLVGAVDVALAPLSERLFIVSQGSDGIEVYGRATSHTITVIAGPGGTVTPAASLTVVHGASQHLTITPDPGYVVDRLLVDGVDVDPVTAYTFAVVVADHTLTATFKAGPETSPTDTVSGRIFATLLGERRPVAGAQLTLIGAGPGLTTTTGGDGRFVFHGVQAGTYQLIVVQAGLRVVSLQVAKYAGQPLALTAIPDLTPPDRGGPCDITGDGLLDLRDIVFWLRGLTVDPTAGNGQ